MLVDNCSNCELRDPVKFCKLCQDSFCENCAIFHPKVKAYRGHKLVDYVKSSGDPQDLICYNCEKQVSKFVCRKCPKDESYFCNGCSIIHPTIRAFRGHALDPIKKGAASVKEVSLGSTKKRTIRFKESETNASSSLSSLSMKQRRGDLSIPTESVAIEEYTEYENSGSSFLTSTLAWFHDLLEKYTRGDDWFSQGLVMLVSFIVYWVVKHCVGNVSVVILIAMAYLTIRTNNANDDKLKDIWSSKGLWNSFVSGLTVSHGVDASEIEKSGVTKESLESHVQGKQQVYADEDFKDEFWHNARQPPLRKRPYMKVEIKNRK